MDRDLAEAIGVESYIYLYPLVLMDVTRRQMTNTVHVSEVPMRMPPDTFMNAARFPPADFRVVVRPNFDTLYSSAFVDLRAEPRIVSVPPAEGNYYLLPMYDMFGEVFACPGTRTTGDDAHYFALVGPDWTGEIPPGIRRYDAPTSWVWIIGRTEASVDTYDKVHAFQAGLTITPLSDWGGEPKPAVGSVDPTVDNVTEPLRTVFAMDAAMFFGDASRLLCEHRPHSHDYPVLDRLARIGFRVGEHFDLAAAEPHVRDALTRAVPLAQQKMTARQHELGVSVNGWRLTIGNMGTYGTDYLQRACVELIGLGANLQEDALYPLTYVDGDGNPLSGQKRYVWHLDKGNLPPVDAFWSLTLYDAEGFQIANDLDRFAVGDRDHLAFNDDGSLDIFIQHEEPAEGASNWLPAPLCEFNLTARLYSPRPEAIDGAWVPPPVMVRT